MVNTPYSQSSSRHSHLRRSSSRVIDGADSTLDAMEKVPVNEKNRPTRDIKLINVGSFCHDAFADREVTIHANPIADGTT